MDAFLITYIAHEQSACAGRGGGGGTKRTVAHMRACACAYAYAHISVNTNYRCRTWLQAQGSSRATTLGTTHGPSERMTAGCPGMPATVSTAMATASLTFGGN